MNITGEGYRMANNGRYAVKNAEVQVKATKIGCAQTTQYEQE